MKYLFLDDVREPVDCLAYMYKELGTNNLIYKQDWTIVRNFKEFVAHINQYGLPDVISFDHDLADEHYTGESLIRYEAFKSPTGYDAAHWLIKYCQDRHLKLPKYLVHSMNPVGKENIQLLLDNYTKYFSHEQKTKENKKNI